MRLYEFDTSMIAMNLHQELLTLKGRAESKGQPAKFNWGAIDELIPDMKIDYDVFDMIYQKHEKLFAPLVHDYNGDGLDLDVPGVAKSRKDGKEAPDSQDNVNKTAASAAMNNISS